MQRINYLSYIQFGFDVHPIVAILGPRQCGKTTLAKQYADQCAASHVTHFDLEDPTHLSRLENPKLALENLRGLIIIDEIQRAPGLFEVLRVLVDENPKTRQFLILGSASRELIQQSSETLAGRIGYLQLTPFTLSEVEHTNLNTLWIRGGFPRSFLANSEAISYQWRKSYVSTFLERDIPALGINIAPSALRRFWMMIAHYHGQTVNYSELGRSFGAADTTIRRYLDVLTSTFMVRQLAPWFENVKKRQVKAPKLYIRDSGIYHVLLDIPTEEAMSLNPKVGPSWEGFVIEQLINHYKAEEGECYFWSVHSRAELDLLIIKNGKRIGFEVKYTDHPKVTQSILTAQNDLRLDETYLVYPGKESFPLTESISAWGLNNVDYWLRPK